MTLTRKQAGDLDDLRYHWTPPFTVHCTGEVWSAALIANPAAVMLTSESAGGLRKQIRDYYASHEEVQRVPRPHSRQGRCWCGTDHLPTERMST